MIVRHGIRKCADIGCRYSAEQLRCFSAVFDEVHKVDLRRRTTESPGAHQWELAEAIRPSFSQQVPVLIQGAVSTAPAISSWNSLNYFQEALKNEAGAVEIGGSYGNADMDRADINLQAYVQYLQLFEERHGKVGPDDPTETPDSISTEELVYLAQNDLFPVLHPDVIIPDFCEDEAYQVGLGRLYSVMFWLGPRGCTSPLHFDPLDNCFMQYSGRKFVWLFDPKTPGNWHYAGHDGQQKNTSPVNPEQNMDNRYPLFRSEGPPPIRCVVEPGDLLYIPSKWWHYVRSLDTAASVNVWWR